MFYVIKELPSKSQSLHDAAIKHMQMYEKSFQKNKLFFKNI